MVKARLQCVEKTHDFLLALIHLVCSLLVFCWLSFPQLNLFCLLTHSIQVNIMVGNSGSI